MEAEAMSEALLHLKGSAMINGHSTADLDEEVAQFRKQSLACTRESSITPDNFAGFTGDYRARRRPRIQDIGVPAHL